LAVCFVLREEGRKERGSRGVGSSAQTSEKKKIRKKTKRGYHLSKKNTRKKGEEKPGTYQAVWRCRKGASAGKNIRGVHKRLKPLKKGVSNTLPDSKNVGGD